MTPRLFDIKTAEHLSYIHARCVECSLWLSIDFNPMRISGHHFICQVFDHTESEVVTGRGATLSDAVASLHEKFLAKGMRV
jgi:hypothetical protein